MYKRIRVCNYINCFLYLVSLLILIISDYLCNFKYTYIHVFNCLHFYEIIEFELIVISNDKFKDKEFVGKQFNYICTYNPNLL